MEGCRGLRKGSGPWGWKAGGAKEGPWALEAAKDKKRMLRRQERLSVRRWREGGKEELEASQN